MESKNREKLLLIATATCVGLYLIVTLLVDPLIDSWHSREAEIVKLTKQIADGQRVIRYREETEGNWDFMRGNALSKDQPVAERQMFNEFHKWVESAGVAPGSFRPQIQESDSNYTTVDCRSDVSGSPETVRDFLRSMSRDTMSDKVQSFELSTKDDNGRQLSLGLNTSGLIIADNDPSVVQLPPPPTNEPAVDTNMPDLYKLIANNNIFDQTRVDRGDRPPRPIVHVAKVETISAHAIGADTNGDAYFEGTGIISTNFYPKGSKVGDFTLVKVGFDTVTLVDSSSNTFVLPVDGTSSLKREDGGPWSRVGYIPPPEAQVSNATASSGGAAPPSSVSAVEEMLRKRRLEAK